MFFFPKDLKAGVYQRAGPIATPMVHMTGDIRMGIGTIYQHIPETGMQSFMKKVTTMMPLS